MLKYSGLIEAKLPFFTFKNIQEFAGEINYNTPDALAVIEEHPYAIGIPHCLAFRQTETKNAARYITNRALLLAVSDLSNKTQLATHLCPAEGQVDLQIGDLDTQNPVAGITNVKHKGLVATLLHLSGELTGSLNAADVLDRT